MSSKIFSAKWFAAVLAVCLMFSTFNMASANESAGTDVEDSWAASTLKDWMAKGWLSGYPDGSVKPDSNVSRAEFAAMVNRALGFTEKADIDFSDLAEGDWEYDQMAIAVGAGYIRGYDDGTMRPGNEVSRQEVAVMLAAMLKLNVSTAGTSTFSDADTIASWSEAAVKAVVAAGIMKGYPDGTFKGDQAMTRAEAAVVISAVIQAKEALASNPKPTPQPTLMPAPTTSPAPTPTSTPSPAQNPGSGSTSTPKPPATPLPVVAMPTASQASNTTIGSGTTITLSTTTAGAVIYYTMDGSIPTTANGTQSNQVVVNGSIREVVTIQAIAVKSGMVTSKVAAFQYTIAAKVATPTAKLTYASVVVNSPNVADNTRINFLSATAGVTFHYEVIGGTNPTGGFLIGGETFLKGNNGQDMTVNVFATKPGETDSETATFTYKIRPQVALSAALPYGALAYEYVYNEFHITDGSVIALASENGSSIRYKLESGIISNPDFTGMIPGNQVLISGQPEDLFTLSITATHPNLAERSNIIYFNIANKVDLVEVLKGTDAGTIKLANISHSRADKKKYRIYSAGETILPLWDQSVNGNPAYIEWNGSTDNIPAKPGDKLVVVTLAVVPQGADQVTAFEVLDLDSSHIKAE